MNIRFLEAFIWVAKLGSFKGAAEKMFTTQAGIASRIATLEEQLGLRLFDREHRGVMLTRRGSEMLRYAEQMVSLQSKMLAVAGKSEDFSGVLRIGVIETVAHTWLPDLLSRFAAQYPSATLEISSNISSHLREELLRGTLDFVIVSGEITSGLVDNHQIARLSTRWVASPELAAKLPTETVLSFADIAAHPIISFHRDSEVYRNIAQGANASAALRISYFSSIGAMIDMAISGFGTALLPLAVVQQKLANGSLVVLPVNPAPTSLTVFASMRLEPASVLADGLVAMARESCQHFIAKSTGDVIVR